MQGVREELVKRDERTGQTVGSGLCKGRNGWEGKDVVGDTILLQLAEMTKDDVLDTEVNRVKGED